MSTQKVVISMPFFLMLKEATLYHDKNYGQKRNNRGRFEVKHAKSTLAIMPKCQETSNHMISTSA